MKCAAIVFPGSSHDLHEIIKDVLEIEVDLVWYQETDLAKYDLLFISGGFSYGDYLRAGALAARTEIITQIREKAEAGTPILAVGNGFQVLLEAGLFPGAMLENQDSAFICQNKKLIVRNNRTIFTSQYDSNELISIPIAHGKGRYHCDEQTLTSLEDNNQIVFTYQDNPNGSVGDIAGIINQQGNVLGMMPHPEHAVEAILGSEDGLRLFQSMINNWREKHATNA